MILLYVAVIELDVVLGQRDYDVSNNNSKAWMYQFGNNGGTLGIHLNILSESIKTKITNEIMKNKNLFRQYRVQNNPEPRLHYLLHEEATEDFTRYDSIKLCLH